MMKVDVILLNQVTPDIDLRSATLWKAGFPGRPEYRLIHMNPIQKDQVIYPTPNESSCVTQNRIQVLKRSLGFSLHSSIYWVTSDLSGLLFSHLLVFPSSFICLFSFFDWFLSHRLFVMKFLTSFYPSELVTSIFSPVNLCFGGFRCDFYFHSFSSIPYMLTSWNSPST